MGVARVRGTLEWGCKFFHSLRIFLLRFGFVRQVASVNAKMSQTMGEGRARQGSGVAGRGRGAGRERQGRQRTCNL